MLFNKIITYSGLSLATLLLLSACSSKKQYSVNNSQINKFYKYNSNPNIRNSKAIHRATLRPYEVFGITYYPKIEKVGQSFRGVASWYGPNFHAKKTSNGETYNMYAMTAAHKTLPMNTMLKVLNLENGKSAIVRVNDRGPFVDERIIDLSNSAARKIDMVRKGTAKVSITVLGYNGLIEADGGPYSQMPTTVVKKEEKNEQLGEIIEPIKIEEKVIISGNYNIQVGAFRRIEGAKITKSKYEKMLNHKKKISIKKIMRNSQVLYKVLITGFDSYNNAQAFKNKNDLNNAVVVENK